MKNLLLIYLTYFCITAYSQSKDTIIYVSDDVELIKLSDAVYIHVSYQQSEKWGRIAANGLVYNQNNEAFLFDTPWTDTQTEALISWLNDSLNTKVIGFMPNHWHNDCMGGLSCIKKHNIKSYANQMTIDIAKSNELPLPDIGFTDSIKLQLGSKQINCYYLGAAHSMDNTVVWIPSEQLLFAGCVLKGLSYKNIGFVGDGDLKAYPATINNLLTKFPNAKIVIPGHGKYGGIELIQHTLKLVSN